MEADIRIIVATLTGFVAFAAVSAQAVPNTKHENWRPLDTALSFALGDQACGDDRHQTNGQKSCCTFDLMIRSNGETWKAMTTCR
jgi:hypothetical protein